ncbi:uncharacterized protein LOC117817664 [Notolabrus celidotus]|uniref:uncharacterized protein LOC117817664 n=1 Tax=Notolabrus celidotus TaxID=1203425 RepID=UPI00148FED8A|nr:uncharacterized protein LOC117817664 [Notolabrus celidotus]
MPDRPFPRHQVEVSCEYLVKAHVGQTKDTPHRLSSTVVKPGDNVTLSCSISGDGAGLFNWYMMKSGYMVLTVAAGSFDKVTLDKKFDNSRFTIKRGDNLFFLTINNVSIEDEATYFCQAGTPYTMKVVSSTVLTVNDHKNHQKSIYLKQIPKTASVQAGDSVTLQCSYLFKYKETTAQCPGEHSVYWFRAGSGESNPSVIYSQSHKSDEEETRSCVYSLSKTIQSSSDAGTYYCAVATCGEILFGEGTTVETKISREEWTPVVIVLGSLLALCVIVIAILIFSRD